MKGFYRQKKKSNSKTGIIKPSPPTKTKNKNHDASIGSVITQPPSLISHGSLDLKDDYDKNESLLRQFDMNMVYGPCIGMTRLARWQRAQRLGLNPPGEIEGLLNDGKVGLECLWGGRV
ncbi:hypothetical protein K2173_026480 [Erythroxylum novogranatense]|uniref:DNA polymerase delta subunit 4 n=1 Tax=Erythroxylum novogranatense TaxID=1862640 RepID=A0AAV8U046_9ROSI|nr:hypothetical protein K2173_026480 [Erythroxylum novogranatense]